MKAIIESLLRGSLASLVDAGKLPTEALANVPVEYCKDPQHGDFASPVALSLARLARAKPRDIAGWIVEALPADARVEAVDIAGPGFINVRLRASAWGALLKQVHSAGDDYGRGAPGSRGKLQVEFVSANPTGPLHVGHGRGAVFGASLANVLEAAGFDVQREYYVNDAGRQMEILAVSTWLRYLEAAGGDALPAFPSKAYQGGYVRDMAADLRAAHGERFERAAGDVAAGLPADGEGPAAEAYVDALVARMRALLDSGSFTAVFDHALEAQRSGIRDDLASLGIEFDRFFSEASLTTGGQVDTVIERLEASGHAYRRDGALWLAAEALGDEKDRVIERSDGRRTYFASDLAYLVDKFKRGFDPAIYVLGADHHGYIARLRAAAQALGFAPARVEVLLTQLAQLYRGGEMVQMSTRAGEFVELGELRDEVGRDAVRFFYIQRKNDQRLDFDIDLAKSQRNENPVYYVQYAHARVRSVQRAAAARGWALDDEAMAGCEDASLAPAAAMALLRCIERYPGIVETAAANREPHLVAFYLRELANELHSYYDSGERVLVDDAATRIVRLAIVGGARQVLANGLGLLGVSAPERM